MIELKHILDTYVFLEPVQDLGMVPGGHRRIINIKGGTFEGERLKGKVLPGGADWQIILPDGTACLDARYTLETEDGSLIYVNNRGFRHGPPDVFEKLMKGEPVERGSYYFKSAPTFETSAPDLYWMNRIIAVADCGRNPESVEISMYEVV